MLHVKRTIKDAFSRLDKSEGSISELEERAMKSFLTYKEKKKVKIGIKKNRIYDIWEII